MNNFVINILIKGFFTLAVILFLVPQAVHGATVVRSGEDISLTTDQSVEGDFYALGEAITVSGQVTDDTILFAGEIKINGEVGADVLVIGGSVDIQGNVVDDVRVMAGKVVIAGAVQGNLAVVAQELKILSTAKIDGDVLFYGGKADIAGPVGGNILGASESVRVDAEVGKGINITTGLLTLGERAMVKEDVSYKSTAEMVRAQNATVEGNVLQTKLELESQTSLKVEAIAFLVSLFAALLVYLLLRKLTVSMVDQSKTNWVRAVAIGFGFFFLLPIAVIILIASTLGAIIGLILLAAYIMILALAFALTGIVIGANVMSYIIKSRELSVVTIVVGVLILHALTFIPLFGPVAFAFFYLLTLGVVTDRLLRLVRLS